MAPPPRAAPSSSRNSMRPPPRPTAAQHISTLARAPSSRAPSPAPSLLSNNASGAGIKRKEREFDQDHGGEETNIHVVVRCRGRSEREVRENSGVVVSTNGVKGKTVELSMGPNAISNKTYHFDKVFSPAADQAIIFEDVVAPILTEMLDGYNCTIFAYGQTGTGKTYTMSGDMTDTLGILSDAAGIIPRVLYSLFQKLDSDEVECSVKCSFIELYNEELRDLLSADDSVKLKIFDDPNKKAHSATMVQGMEESHIKSASAGIKLLQEGSHRRQVAATKCNDLSSRSHTVFTITTYVKKVSEVGEDYICSGKLNLVDLAGSENIQRSGAENKRAAEAGLINKSLLTLGRVINALVDKGSHIPYRESKLTRLLQDSLGGRTKTCIIATVSPAKSNLEETISTLDYAFRAKNIRNKPQVNSMISKKTLLKEFTAEIEKLKSELIATRQRNGVYLSNEQYEEITVESESRRILSEEQKARIETMEASLRNKVQELFSLTSNLSTLKRDNDATRTALESTKDVLVKTELVLADTRIELENETAVREAHEDTEERLYGIGTQLVSTIGASVSDVNALHAKLRRRSDLHAQNKQLWQLSTDNVVEVASTVDARIEDFQHAHEHLFAESSSRIESFLSAEKARLQDSADLILERASGLGRNCASVESQSSNARDAMNNILEEIKVLREEVKDKVGEGLRGLSQAAAKISAEVMGELDQFHHQLHASYAGLGKDFKTLFEDLTAQLAAQRAEADSLRNALEAANRANIQATTAVSSDLHNMLEEERKASEEERERLKQQIFEMLETSAMRQQERLSDKLIGTQTQLIEATEKFETADQVYRAGMDKWTVREDDFMGKMSQSRDDLKNKMKSDWDAVKARNTAIQESTKSVHQETVKIVDAQLSQMATQMAALDEFVTRARSQNDSHHDERVIALERMRTHTQDGFTTLQRDMQDRQSAHERFQSHFEDDSVTAAALVNSLQTSARQPLQNLTGEITTASLTDYAATGQTPGKRDWVYPTTLPRTDGHPSIIARLRGLPDPAVIAAATKTPSSSKTPLRSPKKNGSPRKLPSSPSKCSSPSKTKVYADTVAESSHSSDARVHISTTPFEAKGLKEIDVNLLARPTTSSSASAPDDKPSLDKMAFPTVPVSDFSKSMSAAGQPPLKRHATVSAVENTKLPAKMTRARTTLAATVGGAENNFSQSLGPIIMGGGGGAGRRLRSSPPQ